MPKLKEREDNVRFSWISLDKISQNKSRRIWFHAASMGEFEQAKPIIEQLKKEDPDTTIICSFYSPSGYKNQIDYKFADAIVYMPFDTPGNAKEFLRLVNPDFAVFVRYEAWHNHLKELNRRRIPVILISATYPSDSVLNRCFIAKSFHKMNYSLFSSIFTVGHKHSEYFESLGMGNQIITLSDTRFDRILEKVDSAINKPVIPRNFFADDDFVLVAGSTWEPDEDILIESLERFEKLNQKIRMIIVPHEPTEEHVSQLKIKLENSVLLSDILANIDEPQKYKNKHIIVDSIGKLLSLYANANAAYVGGAFGVGVHSLTEPAGYGIPVACGPNCFNSPDTEELISSDALTIIEDTDTFTDWLSSIISNQELCEAIGERATEYIHSHAGSAKIISDLIIRHEK